MPAPASLAFLLAAILRALLLGRPVMVVFTGFGASQPGGPNAGSFTSSPASLIFAPIAAEFGHVPISSLEKITFWL